MTDQDTDEATTQDEQDTATEEQPSSQDSGQDDSDTSGDGEETSESASGVVVEGYETNNAPREQTKALLEADSPDDVEDDLIKEIEEERDRRLDPENRPDNVEVDNTKRVFVPAEAKFEDSDIDQDPSLGQEGLAPVGGDKDPARNTDSDDSDGSDSDGSDSDDSGSRDDTPRGEADAAGRSEPEEDPQDSSDAVTSGSSDPTGSDDGSGDNDAGSAEARGGKHKA